MTEANDKKQIDTIDMTPTWAAVLPVYLEAFAANHNGTNCAAYKAAKSELERMARLADLYVTMTKAKKENE